MTKQKSSFHLQFLLCHYLYGNIKTWKRNVYKKWLDFQVKIISDVDMHEDIEPKKPRFTLVKKIR